jgi:hypothetical protein
MKEFALDVPILLLAKHADSMARKCCSTPNRTTGSRARAWAAQVGAGTGDADGMQQGQRYHKRHGKVQQVGELGYGYSSSGLRSGTCG